MKFTRAYRTPFYLFPVSLEESIGQDNVVGAVDVFVESLPFKELGFKVDFVENGRPAYHPKGLLQVFSLRISERNMTFHGAARLLADCLYHTGHFRNNPLINNFKSKTER
jgi:transposase